MKDARAANYLSDWNSIKMILAVARAGSYFAAAPMLGLHQTSLSRRVRQLEQELNATLFVRHAHGVQLTAAGQALVEKAQEMEQAAESLRSDLAGYDRRLSGLLRLQVTEGVGTYWLVRAMAEFTQEYPEIHIELLPGIHPADLLAGEADLCLTIHRPRDPRVVGKRVASLSYGLFASRQYLRMHDAPVDLASLARHRLLDLDLYQTDPELGWWRDILLARGGPSFNTRTLGLYVAAIREGYGVGLLPSFYRHVPLDLIRLPTTINSTTELWLLTHEATNQSLKIKTMARYLYARFDDEGRRWFT
jgi:DNA-binding transcriptional LysR family regulator